MEKATVIEALNKSNNEKYITPFTLGKVVGGVKNSNKYEYHII